MWAQLSACRTRSTITRTCRGDRIPDRATLEREVVAWQTRRNTIGGRVDWRFTAEDVRLTLTRLDPVVER